MDVKKVLFLRDPESDLGVTFLYYGLNRLLGDDNVIDFPYDSSYHGCQTWWKRPGEEKDYDTSPMSWMAEGVGGENLTFEDVIDRVRTKWFDVIVLSSPRLVAVETLYKIQNELQSIDIPVVFVDAQDGSNFDWDIYDDSQAKLMFKRELFKSCDDVKSATVYPLPFSGPLGGYPDLSGIERTCDVFFSLGKTWPIREDLYAELSLVKDDFNLHLHMTDNDPQSERLSWYEYIVAMAGSKIAISARGWGWDTCRYWEIPLTGALMLCDRVAINIPHPFVEDEHIVCYDDAKDCIRKIKELLADDERRERIAAAGKAHALEFHTCKARAQYFVDTINGAIQ